MSIEIDLILRMPRVVDVNINKLWKDNHFIQKRILSMLSLRSFRTAISILTEVEAMHMIKKNRLMYGISLFQTKNNSFISSLD